MDRKTQYHEYLKSAEWVEFRAHIIKKRGNRCEKCGATKYIQAHHLTYARIFVELESDIQLLCKKCHQQVHKKKIKKPNKVKKKPKNKSKRNYDAISANDKRLQEKRNKLKKEGKLK